MSRRVVACSGGFVDGAKRWGGETWLWAGSTGSLDVCLTNAEVEPYSRTRCPYPMPCPECGSKFVTGRAMDSHRRLAHRIAPSVGAARNTGTW